ncbi:glycoside hydrolase 61 [Coniochaeta pulveracea]|uniref:lytic cellulose monooxygenase (C4-dehydrogenating) n=1 Tax=Coniochaeta pulveracea TaxID=177199 RepID=A0A420XZ60_9PEZI|nr:glycoside hydrolase 61 [Coniochaeta pulveracea]
MGNAGIKFLFALASAASVSGHGYVTNIVINGVSYLGFNGAAYPYLPNPPPSIGWITTVTDNGFVSPSAFGDPDIICHRGATPANGHAVVAAGEKISLQWLVPWPDSHHGPVLDYLANCNGPCETVDKTSLEFFKIDGAGWVSGGNPGLWASDTLIQNNSTWLVQIPPGIAPGNYVLRHEIIALHSAGSTNGAQAYPQCINLQVTGSGSSKPSGVKGTSLYKSTDPGILFNIYTSPISYTVPGPTLISGVASSIAQSSSKITASASPITGTGVVSAPTSGPAATTTTKATTSGPTTAPTTAPKTTSTSTTTLKTVTTTNPTTTTAGSGSGATQSKYGQCGGSGYTGPTVCAGGTCSTMNAYYAQCV